MPAFSAHCVAAPQYLSALTEIKPRKLFPAVARSRGSRQVPHEKHAQPSNPAFSRRRHLVNATTAKCDVVVAARVAAVVVLAEGARLSKSHDSLVTIRWCGMRLVKSPGRVPTSRGSWTRAGFASAPRVWSSI